MSVTTHLRVRKKLSQLLVSVLIAPLFSFVPVVSGSSVLPSAQAIGTGYCETEVSSSSGVVAVSSGSH